MNHDLNLPPSSSYGQEPPPYRQQQFMEYEQQPPPYAQPYYGQHPSNHPQSPYVSVWPRAAATIIDWFLLAVIFQVSSLIFILTAQNAPNAPDLLFIPFPFLLFFGYFIVMEAMWGATLGKMMLGLRVVKTDGSPIGWSQAVVRNLLRVIDVLFCYLVGAILIWDSPLHQRLGDRAAKTVVVRRQPQKRQLKD